MGDGHRALPTVLVLVGVCSVVRLRRSREETAHQGAKCFEFWKECMRQKYGYYHQWF